MTRWRSPPTPRTSGAGHVVAAVDPEGWIVEHLFDGAGREVATILPTVDVVDPSGSTGDGPLERRRIPDTHPLVLARQWVWTRVVA